MRFNVFNSAIELRELNPQASYSALIGNWLNNKTSESFCDRRLDQR
jgi:hypothetical protein